MDAKKGLLYLAALSPRAFVAVVPALPALPVSPLTAATSVTATAGIVAASAAGGPLIASPNAIGLVPQI